MDLDAAWEALSRLQVIESSITLPWWRRCSPLRKGGKRHRVRVCTFAPRAPRKTMTAVDGRVVPLIPAGPYIGKPRRGGGNGPSPVSAVRPQENARALVQQPVLLPPLRTRLRCGRGTDTGADDATGVGETRRCAPTPSLSANSNDRRSVV